VQLYADTNGELCCQLTSNITPTSKCKHLNCIICKFATNQCSSPIFDYKPREHFQLNLREQLKRAYSKKKKKKEKKKKTIIHIHILPRTKMLFLKMHKNKLSAYVSVIHLAKRFCWLCILLVKSKTSATLASCIFFIPLVRKISKK